MNVPWLSASDTPIQWYQISAIGIIIFLSGTDAFFWTSMFLGILIPLFGLLALVVGLIMIAFSISFRQDLVYRFPIFFAGIISLVVAAIALMIPGLIEPPFVIILAILAIINSILLILVGCTVSDQWKTRLVIVLFGLLTLFLSILMALFPVLSDIALVKIWGIYAWVIGALCIAAGISMRNNGISDSESPSILALP
ncbi:MAG: DUF308 domain-containing protein [Methanoregula sp.]|jgi:uncharacterized membrane protein HdeD (DUF308 family)|nr:DUF308 domain-containing protein [Methanoregula sp.]